MNRTARLASVFGVSALLAVTATAKQDAKDAKDPTPQNAYIDYDRSATLSRFKTFAVAEPKSDESLAERSQLTHRHLLGAIRKRLLSAGRLTENTADPDLYVTYRVVNDEGKDMNPDGYATGPGWKGGYYWAGSSWGVASETVSTYPVGTLVIDAWDAKTKRAVWRGVASGAAAADTQKANKKIDVALDMLMKKWETMRAEGK